MTEVTKNLYLGTSRNAFDQAFLHRLGIQGIVNVTVTEPNKYPESYDYLRVSVMDYLTERLHPFFQSVFDFIERHRNDDRPVLVHCQMGISRSPTIVIAYLMMKDKRSLTDVFRSVKALRPVIEPNPAFLRELRQLERSLFNQVISVESLTPYDFGYEEEKVDEILPNLLADLTSAYAADAPQDSIERLRQQLLNSTEHENIDQGICKALERSSGSNERDVKGREGLRQELRAFCVAHQIDLKTIIEQLRTSDLWKEFCIDVPSANRCLDEIDGE